ncbi:protein of unknown function [Candidatus Methylomirabilis oxygeniifera]|uniref:Uncharacterized protein n=1 Tax=Methylomirabilis oxygeniifera TaxID=671143 RepID=D5MEY8_METO1|nr:protein of unknown function [Candidatus Methylomirabilis oxyfera]
MPRKSPCGSLRGSEVTEAISQSLGWVVAGKNSEIATLQLVACNDHAAGGERNEHSTLVAV